MARVREVRVRVSFKDNKRCRSGLRANVRG